METCRSPLEMLRRAYELGQRLWPDHASPFSRHDFTRPQLFACLVLREHQRLSYRRTEVLLIDVPDWRREIGMEGVPDHNTLWRAFAVRVPSPTSSSSRARQRSGYGDPQLLRREPAALAGPVERAPHDLVELRRRHPRVPGAVGLGADEAGSRRARLWTLIASAERHGLRKPSSTGGVFHGKDTFPSPQDPTRTTRVTGVGNVSNRRKKPEGSILGPLALTPPPEPLPHPGPQTPPPSRPPPGTSPPPVPAWRVHSSAATAKHSARRDGGTHPAP